MNTDKEIKNASDLWKLEYDNKGIPSSFREEPSGSVEEFVTFLREQGVTSGAALDLGCGTGRNSVFLAQQGFDVHSIEIVAEMLDRLQHVATELGLDGHIHTHHQSVTSDWPFPDGLFNVVIGTFCYKHQIESSLKTRYRQELARTVRSGGFYLLTLAGTDDGYYGPLLEQSPDIEHRVIVDPANNIRSILYSKEDVEAEFSSAFEVVYYSHKSKDGMMHGRRYRRSTHLFIMRRL